MSLLALVRRYERRRRFWRHVRVGGPDECWPWLGTTVTGGRGVHDGRPACETAYELAGHQLPPGTSLQHRCGNAWCVNPHHLERRDAGPQARV